MARLARFTDPHNIMVTKTTADLVLEVSERVNLDKAPVGRFALDLLFDLVDGELREGDTAEAAVNRVIDEMVDQGLVKSPATAPESAA